MNECYDEIQKQTLEIIQTDLYDYMQQQTKRQEVLNGDIDDLLKQQETLKKQDTITREQKKQYNEDKDQYFKNSKDHYTTTQTVLRTTKENIDPDRYNTEDIPEGAKQFIQILQQGRQQNDNN